MTLELHWVSGSPYAWRVQLALAFKGLEYVSRLHQISTGELRSASYLAQNPRGRVPTLVHDGFVLYESLAILAYLDREFAAPPLFGESAQATGLVWRHIAEYTAYADPAVEAFVVPIYFGEAEAKAAEVRAAAAVLESELAGWERALAAAPYFAGARPSAADFVIFPAVKSIERAAGKAAAKALGIELLPIAARWPRIAAWLGRIEQLPGYAQTYPPHWR
jgi:glutathione S-transferase